MASGSSPSGSGFLCTFVRGLVDLESHRAAIDDLAQRSIEANPFYQPWMLFPALVGLGESSRVGFLLVFREVEIHRVSPVWLLPVPPVAHGSWLNGTPLSGR